ncbi:uncharacterized protein AC631_05575 [Debaryomyces fabryi]|uniref:Alpha-1,2-mannosyltransferase MNN2 n=1 Tax=Debaryomyces fabryi TaxID=58627 RepID=A0A0V1PRN2_9ASCO|nr:uncharacterized protein AC631_05575 [Debaryomyces fabryi]KRZ98670.1 hypothetical protein AC631_05575 [Debaryomyces fabryi]CUM48413.1 unnamed protein product [Debaryomyces fabryi]
MFPTRLPRGKLRLFGVLLLIVVLFFTAQQASKDKYKSLSETLTKVEKYSPFSSQKTNEAHQGFDVKPKVQDYKESPEHEFWEKIFAILNKGKADIPQDQMASAIQYIEKSKQKKGQNTKDVLLSKAYVSDEVIKEFQKKHKLVLDELPSNLEATYKPNTNGVVFVGGGRFSWLSYLSLLGLRATGSEVPVEVMMPTYSDYENEVEFCTVILPRLNAACVVVPDSLGSSVMLSWNKKFKSYQFKSLALMTSSFQNILLLDSDNILIQNPDSIFESDLFKEYGMIMWPDYWRRTTSPIFYDVAGVKINERKRIRSSRFSLNVDKSNTNLNDNEINTVPYHDLEGAVPDLSTESGQLFINKATHGKTLLLSLYYNIYGPDQFYKLLSLGAPGEGDKDTFATAATVLKQKFYQIKSHIKTVGYFENGNFQGVAMGQKNPLKDYERFKEKFYAPIMKEENRNKPVNEQIDMIEKLMKDNPLDSNETPVFAMHCNFPKLDPLDLISRDSIYDKDKNQLKYKIYNGFSFRRSDNKNEPKVNFELQQWKTIQNVICNEKLYFIHFSKVDNNELCQFINNQVKWLSK